MAITAAIRIGIPPTRKTLDAIRRVATSSGFHLAGT
jgi:hypothetical protein